MATGKIKWFNASKGFGFITPNDGSADVFVHISALESSKIKVSDLREGQYVTYEVQTEKNRTSATNIALA